MVLNVAHYLKPISAVLNVQLDKSTTKARIVHDHTITSSIFKLLEKSKSSLGGKDYQEDAEIQQWIEYCTVYVAHIDCPHNVISILGVLNNLLATKTYLVANRITVADILLYHMLVQVVDQLTVVEKEKFLNVCRWFDNIQQDSALRRQNKLVDFTTNYLAVQAPPRH